MILNHLIFGNAHARLFNGHFCKGNPLGVGSGCGGLEYRVNLLLRIGSEFFLRFSYLSDLCFKRFNTVNNFGYRFLFFHSVNLRSYQNFLSALSVF